MKKKFILFLSFFFLILIFFYFFLTKNKNQDKTISKIVKNKSVYNNYGYIAHGGGGYDGQTYTNSLEAIKKSYHNGFRLIELDLQVTTDSRIVAVHNWSTFKKNCSNFSDFSDKAISYYEFNNCNYIIKNKKLTQLNEEQIKNFFLENKDTFLVTDKIRNLNLLVKKFNFTDRMFVEVFNIKDYLNAKKLGIKFPMYPYNGYFRFFEKIFKINVIVVSSSKFERNKEHIKNFYDRGNAVFVYTSNDEKFNKLYIGKYVSTVYTDFWDIKKAKCNLPVFLNKCVVY